MLLVLLTSCVVKTSIKNFAGIPTKTERGVPKGSHSFSTNSVEKCTQFNVSSTLIVQKPSFNAKGLFPAIIFTTAFLFGFRTLSKANKHPLYSGSGKIPSAVPIFLEYRKIIIYYSC